MTFPVFPGSNPSGYNLTNSLRFRASASAYLSRTPASSSSQSRYTLSFWVKRGILGANQTLLSCVAYGNASYQTYFRFNSSDQLEFYNSWGSDLQNLITTQVFRDPSAWYHLVFAINMNGATRADAIQIYVNGSLITAFSTTTYTNVYQATAINSAYAHNFWRDVNTSSSYCDGYMAETYFVDGSQLLPSSFGSTNPVTGVWQPARYTGTYGTNGFYLPFTDNSALTTSSNVGLGKDFSGNGNYWTTNNISITSGTTYDSMTDVPTLTSATAANFAVLNPLATNTTGVLTEGNLKLATSSGTGGSGTWSSAVSTIKIPTNGKFYCELTIGAIDSGYYRQQLGIAADGFASQTTTSVGGSAYGVAYFADDGKVYTNNASFVTLTPSVINDVIGLAFDQAAGSIQFYRNGSAMGSALTGYSSYSYFAASSYGYSTGFINFGQRPFAYTPPTGYVALNTYNLPTSTIVKGNTVMDIGLWTGNGATTTVTYNFAPDFIWTKARSFVKESWVSDTNRGLSVILSSSLNIADVSTGGLVSASGNSIVYGNHPNINSNGDTYVAWNWKGGSNTTNTAGTITSTVSANANAGFSIITYTGNGTIGATVGHGLGVNVGLYFVKNRSAVANWAVLGHALNNAYGGAYKYLLLNTTASVGNAAQGPGNSSTIELYNDATNNASGNNYVAYCFASIPSFSSIGSYTGNGSTNGAFIYTGFRPRFVMVKQTNDVGNWIIWDTARSTYNQMQDYLVPNSSAAESNNVLVSIDSVSNGFKCRTSDNDINGNGDTYIYMAFAENPFKNALAR